MKTIQGPDALRDRSGARDRSAATTQRGLFVKTVACTSAPEGLSDLRREFAALSGLRHPNLVRVRDFRIDSQRGTGYLVTDRVDGVELGAWLRGGPSDQARLQVAFQILSALVYLHAAGLVHGDLKPANVLIQAGESGPRVCLIDFGLSRRASSSSLGTAVGTVGYASPELLLGARPRPESDLYAFGALLYELVADRPAFRGSRLSELVNVQLSWAPPSLPPDTPPGLGAVVRRLLARDPEDRYASAQEAARALKAAVSYSPRRLGSLEAELLSAPFVGRTEYLDRILALLDRPGRAGAVEVLGGRGLGKTRFLEEVSRQARLRAADPTLLGERRRRRLLTWDEADRRPWQGTSLEGALLLAASGRPGGVRLPKEVRLELRVRLTPLTPTETRQLARSLLGGLRLPVRLEADLVARSGGNPGLLHLLVRGLMQQGLVTATMAIVAPALVRLGRLPEDPAEERFLLQATSAWSSRAKRLAAGEEGMDPQQLEQATQELLHSGLVRRDAKGRLVGPSRLPSVLASAPDRQ